MPEVSEVSEISEISDVSETEKTLPRNYRLSGVSGQNYRNYRPSGTRGQIAICGSGSVGERSGIGIAINMKLPSLLSFWPELKE
jgi:hypothetical protein